MKSFTLTFELKIIELDQTMLTQREITDQEIAAIKKEIATDPMSNGITVAEVLAETITEEVVGELYTQLKGVLLRCIC